MILADSHSHSSFSFDSESDPETMIASAIEHGLTALAITDHQDWVPEPFSIQFKPEPYFLRLQELKEKYRGKLDLTIGVEIGLLPEQTEAYRAYTTENPFEFVIGSVHTINGLDPYDPPYFEGKTFDEGYREAFDYTVRCLKLRPDMDVLGHIDYVVRYGDKQNGMGFYARYADELDAILRECIDMGIGIEVNTAGLKYGMPQPNPSEEVLRRYRELGGEIVTVGSDAHEPERIASNFSQIRDLLVRCGYEYYAYYRNRKPVFEKL